MRILRLLLTALATLVLALFVGSNGPASAQPACGTVTANTTLAGDCTGPMIVAASNITIDLNGFAVVNSASEGIRIFGQTNVKVKNGSVVNNSSFGIRFDAGGGKHILTGLQLTNNPTGIFVQAGANSNRIAFNTLTGNTEGIRVQSDRNRISGNNASNNTATGILVVVGQNNRIWNNTALANGGFDLVDGTAGCDNNTWKHNTFSTANQACIN